MDSTAINYEALVNGDSYCQLYPQRPKVGDPYLPNVLVLSPFSDAPGTTAPADLRGNTWTLTQYGSPEPTFQISNNRQLFGLNTLSYIKTSPQNQELLYTSGNNLALAATDSLCVEYWFYEASGNYASTASPVHFNFYGQTAGAPVFTSKIGLATYSNGGKVSAFYGSTYDSGTPSLTFSYGQWNYVALQWVGGTSMLYVYLNGTLIQTINAAAFSGLGYAQGCLTIGNAFGTSGPSALVCDFSWAQLRVTKANRYPGVATIPVPTSPFPNY
jgi:hypothetical protein